MDDTLREATRRDLPKGSEAQCPICWRIFGSDSGCEKHKPYTKPKTDTCKDPEMIGMEPRERRGHAVWVRPMNSSRLASFEGNGGT